MESTLRTLRSLLWVLGLLALMSFGARHFASHPKTGFLNIRGVALGMSMDEVKGLLGKPDTISDMPPLAKGGAFWTYYYGLLAVSQESLGVQFDSSHKVWAVDGESLSRGSELIAQVQTSESAIVSALGKPLGVVRSDSGTTKCDFRGGLTIHLESDQATNFMLSTPEYEQADKTQ